MKALRILLDLPTVRNFVNMASKGTEMHITLMLREIVLPAEVSADGGLFFSRRYSGG